MSTFFKLILILPMCALVSCTVPTDVELANGTSEPLIVTYSKGAGEKIETKVSGKSKGEFRTLLERGGFFVTTKEKILRFEGIGVPEEYVKMSFRSRTVKAQFASDNCIYLVRPDDDSLTILVSRNGQPEGFPLCSK